MELPPFCPHWGPLLKKGGFKAFDSPLCCLFSTSDGSLSIMLGFVDPFIDGLCTLWGKYFFCQAGDPPAMAGCLQILIFLEDFFYSIFCKTVWEKHFFFFVKSFMKCTGYMAAEMKYKECLVSSVAIFMQRRSKSWSVTVSDLACLTCTSELCSAF